MPPRVLRVALTGGIATGKSHCLERFAALGVPVIDADAIARAALRSGTAALQAVLARFGPGVLQPDGSLDRAALGRLVFSDARARGDLEAVVHPIVYRTIEDWLTGLPALRPEHATGASATEATVAIADIPLLYETGHEGAFDRVVVAACTPEQQRERLLARGGLTDAEARQRIGSQWPIAEKIRRADFVIDTSGTFSETDRQVTEVCEKLRAEAASQPNAAS